MTHFIFPTYIQAHPTHQGSAHLLSPNDSIYCKAHSLFSTSRRPIEGRFYNSASSYSQLDTNLNICLC